MSYSHSRSRPSPRRLALVAAPLALALLLGAAATVRSQRPTERQDRAVVRVESREPLSAYLEGLRRALGDDRRVRFEGRELASLDRRTVGSGIVIDRDGHILTTQASLEGGSTYRVVLTDGQELNARLVGEDGKTGLAVLRVAEASALEPLVAAAGTPQPGGRVSLLAPAAPRAAEQARRVTGWLRSGARAGYFTLEGTAPAGASGGAALGPDGELMGIVTAVLRTQQGHDATLVLSTSAAQSVAQQILSRRGAGGAWLGVSLDTWVEGGRGVRVARVQPLSPAQAAGLQNGDRIVSFDGQAVTEVSELVRLVNENSPGRSLELEILRAGAARTLPVQLGSRPGLRSAPRTAQVHMLEPSEAFFGVSLRTLTPGLRGYFGVASDAGVLVEGCDQAGAGCASGLKAGDVIVTVDGREVSEPRALQLQPAGAGRGSGRMMLQIFREGRMVQVDLDLDLTDSMPTQMTLDTDQLESLIHDLLLPTGYRTGEDLAGLKQRVTLIKRQLRSAHPEPASPRF